MTKPLIQQLADRAGFTTPEDITAAECSGYGTTLLLFELCAHLDEQAAETTPAEARDLARSVEVPKRGMSQSELWRPPPTDELVGALHDPIHPPSGNLISSTPVRVKSREPAPEVAIPGACYCSDRMSGGVPCPPSRVCPNAPKPSAASEVAERSELELLHAAYAEKIAHFNDQAAQLAEARADLARVEKNLATAVEDAEWVCKDRDKLLAELKSKDQELKLYKHSSMQLKSRLYNAEEKIRALEQF